MDERVLLFPGEAQSKLRGRRREGGDLDVLYLLGASDRLLRPIRKEPGTKNISKKEILCLAQGQGPRDVISERSGV